jgi:hypothetical protein
MGQHERASAGCERLILSEGSSCEREACGNNHLLMANLLKNS